MNFFAHLFLSEHTDLARIGNSLGDFVRGNEESLHEKFPEEVVTGILNHRRVDAEVDRHPAFLASKELLKENHGRFAGIIIDVLADHFLHVHWDKFTGLCKESFIKSCYKSLQKRIDNLPGRFTYFIEMMVKYDILGGYEDLEEVEYALARIDERISRSTNLANALADIKANYDELSDHFVEFFFHLHKNR